MTLERATDHSYAFMHYKFLLLVLKRTSFCLVNIKKFLISTEDCFKWSFNRKINSFTSRPKFQFRHCYLSKETKNFCQNNIIYYRPINCVGLALQVSFGIIVSYLYSICQKDMKCTCHVVTNMKRPLLNKVNIVRNNWKTRIFSKKSWNQ